MKSKIHYFNEIDSTMNQARILAKENASDFTTVVAERQTCGRGRLDRVWESEKGGLYFTIILKPEIKPENAFLFNFAASLTMAQVLRKKFKINVKTKWPNDLLVNEKKISGLLSEMETGKDVISFLNIGIGVNVNNQVSKCDQAAVSVKELVGKKASRKEILSEFLNKFEEKIKGKKFYDAVSDWKKMTATIGRKVKIVTHSEVKEGDAVDVDESGALILKLADGNLKKIVYGDCFLL